MNAKIYVAAVQRKKLWLVTPFILITTAVAAKKTGYDGIAIPKNGGFTITPRTSPATLRARTQSYNQAGLLDQTFGSKGAVITPVNQTVCQAHAGLLQPDGKIIAVGYTNKNAATVFAVVRYNTDGSLDTSFGTGGSVITDATPGQNSQAQAALFQPNGKIIAVGYGSNGTNDVFALVRYNSDGSIDLSFGTNGNGIVTTDVTPMINSRANAALFQSDGKIIAIGFANNGINDVFALARYNPNGSADLSFGNNGIVMTDVTPMEASQANAAVLQSDNKIVAVGYGTNGTNVFALTRYNTDGSLDTSFGTGGSVTTDIIPGQSSVANAALLQPDGKIVAAGSTTQNTLVLALARYDSDGSLDVSFGANGSTTTDVNPGHTSVVHGAALQRDGKIVAVGHSFNRIYFFVLARYNSDGSLDATFGTGGSIVSDSVGGQIFGAMIQSDGKIVAVGYTVNGGVRFALTRYINPFTYASLAKSYGSIGML